MRQMIVDALWHFCPYDLTRFHSQNCFCNVSVKSMGNFKIFVFILSSSSIGQIEIFFFKGFHAFDYLF